MSNCLELDGRRALALGRPEMVVKVGDVERTPDGLVRHVVYLGEREDKPAIDVRRDRPTRDCYEAPLRTGRRRLRHGWSPVRYRGALPGGDPACRRRRWAPDRTRHLQ